VRSPFSSEPEAFHSVIVLALVLIAVVLAATLGPTWLAVTVLVVAVGVLAFRMGQVHMRKLQRRDVPLKMAPPHMGPATERRVLVVANDTLDEDALISEVERLASTPTTRVFLLVPALISTGARITGGVDGVLDQARTRLKCALDRVGHHDIVGGEFSQADPLEAVQDTFATFAPDEVIVATRWERTAGGLEPELAGLVRERFAVPVRHLVFEPGAAAKEPSKDEEARYQRESGQAAARSFGLRALAGVGVAAAVVMSMVAMVRSSERGEARADAQAAAQAAWLPTVAKVVDLSVIPEWKRGPEGEKHDAFTVTEFTVRAGQAQELRIDNTDTVPHSITAPEAGVNIVVMPGTHTYTLLVKRPGTYVWFCTFVCDEWAMVHPGYMRGFIHVA
jgi:plastocyanin